MLTTSTPSAEHAKAWLSKWDSGDIVWSIEMGGLGPGYEQCIQITAAEILRWLLKKNCDASSWQNPENWKKDRVRLEKAMHKTKTINDLGLSGAQYGAALSLASALYKRGTDALNDEEVRDRRIQVSKAFPHP